MKTSEELITAVDDSKSKGAFVMKIGIASVKSAKKGLIGKKSFNGKKIVY